MVKETESLSVESDEAWQAMVAIKEAIGRIYGSSLGYIDTHKVSTSIALCFQGWLSRQKPDADVIASVTANFLTRIYCNEGKVEDTVTVKALVPKLKSGLYHAIRSKQRNAHHLSYDSLVSQIEVRVDL